MNRDELEARFTELLIQGREPMDEPDIRDAVAADPTVGNSLDELRGFIGKLGDLQWPRLDERKNIRYMTQAFEEGFSQGRTVGLHQAASRAPGPGWLRRWLPSAAVGVAAILIGIIGGMSMGQRMNQNGELDRLRADVRGLHETVAISLLENQAASQRIRGLQWSQQIDQPGEKLIDELTATLRGDDNVNVRLAAADAMSRFTTDPVVRAAIYETVLQESHPLVQAHLIDVIVITRSADATVVLEQLAKNPDLTNVVRTKASVALTEMDDL